MRYNTLKKISVLCAFVTLLSGCRWFDGALVSEADNSVLNVPINSEKVTVTVFADETVFKKDMLSDMANAFCEENTDIKIDIIYSDNSDDTSYDNELTEMFANNNAPDMFLMYSKTGVYDWTYALAPIKSDWTQKISPALPTAKSDDNVMAVPASLNWAGIAVSTDIAQYFDVDVEKVNDFSSFEKMMSELNEKHEKAKSDNENKNEYKFSDLRAISELPAGTDSYLSEFIIRPISSGIGKDDVKSLCDLMMNYTYWSDNKKNLNVIKLSELTQNGLDDNSVAVGLIDSDMYSELSKSSDNKYKILPYFLKSTVESGILLWSDVFWGINRYSDSDKIEAANRFLEWINTSQRAFEISCKYGVSMITKDIFTERGVTITHIIGDYINTNRVIAVNEDGKTSEEQTTLYNIRQYISGNKEWNEIFENTDSTEE